MSTDHQEIEWQFDAPDLTRVSRWLRAGYFDGAVTLGPGSVIDLADCYLDTGDWGFHRAGYALRIRHANRHVEATLKAFGTSVDGVRHRREVSETLADDAIDTLMAAPGAVGARARAIAGKRPVRQLFEVRTRRREYAVKHNGLAAGVVSLDETRISGIDADTLITRVEVEVEPGAAAALKTWVESMRSACALRPAEVSKYEAGLRAWHLVPILLPDLGQPAPVDKRIPAGALAFNAMREYFAAILLGEPGARLGDDPEGVHRLRVACRKLRSTMSLFGACLPPETGGLREELRWLSSALGEVRDLDVQLSRLDGWLAGLDGSERGAAGLLIGALADQRAEARARLLAVLDSERYARFVEAFATYLRRAAAAGGSTDPAVAYMPDLIARRYRRMRQAIAALGEATPPPVYHALRILVKRLRYAVDCAAELYGKPARRWMAKLGELQDVLGQYHDSQVAIAWIGEMAQPRGRGRELLPQARFTLGEIAQRCVRQGDELKVQFPAAFDSVTGKSWKQLQRVMREKRHS